VLIDPGTYGYNAAPPFARAFSTASCHNVPRLLEREPARRLSRFLFAPWPEGAARFDPVEERFSATHTAYRQQGVSFVRELCALGDDEFEIVDRVHSQAPTRVGIHWLLADADWAGDLAEPRAGALSALFGSRRVQLRWQSSIQPEDVSLVRCSPDTDRGWQAIRYLELGPAQSLLLSFALHGALTLRTRVRSVGEAFDIAPSRVRR
jgi:Heparinase II/III-like protein